MILTVYKRCNKLTELNLSYCRITNIVVENLPESLVKLDLSHIPEVTPLEIFGLRSMPRLGVLNFEHRQKPIN